MRHSTVVDESGATTQTTHRWDAPIIATGGGDFHVVIDIGEDAKVVETEWQYIPRESDRAEYEAWLETSSERPNIPLPTLSPAHGPFEEIAVVQLPRTGRRSTLPAAPIVAVANTVHGAMFSFNSENNATGPKLLRRESGMLQPGGTYLVTTAQPTFLSARGDWTVGSGIAFHNGTMRRGSAVTQTLSPGGASRTSSAQFSSSCCGDFLAACLRMDGSIEFHSDYLGTSAWYEYQSDRIRIVASSFLLAAHLVEACGEELSLNLATIDADFTSLTQPFQQPLLDDLELDGFSCLQPDRVLILSSDSEATREQSKLGHDAAAPERFTLDRYHDLLEQAAEELTANCAAIADDSEIRNIRCDISGGLDSRLVLAGFLAASTEARAKLALYTEPPGRAPSTDDPKIAAMVATATGLPFSDQPEMQIGPCSVTHRAATQISATFGTYWHRGHSHAQVWDPTTIHVGGTGLDDVARDYTTGAWQISATPALMPAEISLNLAKQVFKWRGRATLKAAPHRGVTDIAAGWDDLPGDELDKGSRLFNSHRSRFHGGGRIPAVLGTFRASPGPVRSLYLLRLMSGRHFDGPTIQLELIHRLNPQLAAVPYESAQNNHAYASLYKAPTADLDWSLEPLRLAADQRREDHRWVPCHECATEQPGDDHDVKGLTLQALRELGRDPLLHEIMLAAYRFARDHFGTTYGLDHSYSRTFMNKVLHLHAMWRMSRRESLSRPG